MEEVLVPLAFFGMIFGIVYLYYSTRHKERLTLIENGADVSIFEKSNKGLSSSKYIILNLALLLMGIGLGVIIGGVLQDVLNVNEDIAMPGSIFLLAGTGLLTGFFLTKKMEKEV